MIGTRTPFRISFAGGGSDFPEFYREQQGYVVSTAIDQYMYIFVHPFFDEKIQVKYSKTELVDRIEDIQHPIVREILKKFELTGVDINSIADIPAGTGLGSSSSFTVGLLHALYAYLSVYVSKERLAREACEIEIDRLHDPIGKQDQYAAAHGGLNFITFFPNGSVNVEPILVPPDAQARLADNLVLFYLGVSRSAGSVLTDQKQRLISDPKARLNLVQMTALAQQLRGSLVQGAVDDVGLILDESWQRKRQLSPLISNGEIDYYYAAGIKSGALGGKLLGAGGGGFLLFYCPVEHQERLKESLSPLQTVKFSFDNFGTKVVYVSEDRRTEKIPSSTIPLVSGTAVSLSRNQQVPGEDPVSVVVNVFNEAKTIEKEIREIHAAVVEKLPGSELIVAEDGSKDGTKEIIATLVQELGIIHSTSEQRKGYTRALRDALRIAKNPYVFFSDTGGKLNFEDFWKLYPHRKQYGLVVGYRSGRQDQLYRRALTYGYNSLLRWYFHVSLQDSDESDFGSMTPVWCRNFSKKIG